MYLLVILAFAIVLWRTDEPVLVLGFTDSNPLLTGAIVWGPPLVLSLIAWVVGNHARRRLQRQPELPEAVQFLHHRLLAILRLFLLVGFAIAVLSTPWPAWFRLGRVHPALQIVGDVVVLSPFFFGTVALWVAAYPLERELRGLALSHGESAAATHGKMLSYLEFHIRHHLLIVTVPMLLILFAANLTDAYEDGLRRFSRSVWGPDLALASVAAIVFVTSPLMLVRIWKTAPLPDGPVRQRLEETCRHIQLRCRDILVWPSDGMMVNAAVMGLFAPVRYILLSDGLLSTMTPSQIEAVFGHEAGHVRHRHIQHFLIFALAGWLVVAGAMEGMARSAQNGHVDWWTPPFIQGTGVVATLFFWGVGFGWLSRRFERQADLFGARCVTPAADDRCVVPCSVHGGEKRGDRSDARVCATGAAVFASALDTVAILNGIPHEERSWRHSSIGSRIRFLSSLAGDPGRAANFERGLSRITKEMWSLAIIGSAFWLYYGLTVPEPLILKL